MPSLFTRFVLIGSLIVGLASCSYFQKNNDNNKAFCREMKYHMIFNGATGNQQKAMQQRAEMRTLNKSYRAHGCQ